MFKLILLALAITPVLASSYIEEVVVAKKNCRRGIREMSESFRNKSGIEYGDQAESLVETPSKMIRNLLTLEEKKLNSGSLKIAPWSDSYWPLYQGALGNRYNDPMFMFYEWQDAFKYIKENPAKKFILNKQLDILSPAEKYDYLLRIENDGLTKTNWDEGKYYFDSTGKVETWMGLCHGWSAASIMMAEPKKTVSIRTNDNEIPFYASDIKGLSTLLWANVSFNTRFVGGRCNKKDPTTDSMGRPVDEECLDNNPGTWHMAIVNQIGQFKRSFVMDATYDYEVWNQPVYSYSSKFYNPMTKKEVENLNEAIVSRDQFLDDPRAKVRDTKAVSIVGVKMRVRYVVETSPSTSENQTTAFKTVQYEYDLELDKKMNIIGGEWYSDNHPDFLWVPEKNSFPQNYGDSPLKRANLSSITTEDSQMAKLNAKNELPYGPVVRALVESSK